MSSTSGLIHVEDGNPSSINDTIEYFTIASEGDAIDFGDLSYSNGFMLPVNHQVPQEDCFWWINTI